MLRRLISLVLTFGLLFQQAGFAQIAVDISKYFAASNIVSMDRLRPVHMRYFSLNPASGDLNFVLDKGDLRNIGKKELDLQGKEVFKYFLIGLALPNESFWVNLRPDSPENMIDAYLCQTEAGKIFLETDLQLKKDTALLTSPQNPLGRQYWDRLYQKAGEIFGNENVTIPTLTRPWIVPGEVIVRHSKDSVYLYKATLKVMLEQDYLKDSATYNFSDPRLKELNEYSSRLIRELILPKLNKLVNNASRYARLRQVYYSLILAQWFKTNFSADASGKYAKFIDSRNLSGLTSLDNWSSTKYFKQYQKSFQQGEYNIKEPHPGLTGATIRTYFSGGITVGKIPFAEIQAKNSLITGNTLVSSSITDIPVFAAELLKTNKFTVYSPETGIVFSPTEKEKSAEIEFSRKSGSFEIDEKLLNGTEKIIVTAKEGQEESLLLEVSLKNGELLTTIKNKQIRNPRNVANDAVFYYKHSLELFRITKSESDINFIPYISSVPHGLSISYFAQKIPVSSPANLSNKEFSQVLKEINKAVKKRNAELGAFSRELLQYIAEKENNQELFNFVNSVLIQFYRPSNKLYVFLPYALPSSTIDFKGTIFLPNNDTGRSEFHWSTDNEDRAYIINKIIENAKNKYGRQITHVSSPVVANEVLPLAKDNRIKVIIVDVNNIGKDFAKALEAADYKVYSPGNFTGFISGSKDYSEEEILFAGFESGFRSDLYPKVSYIILHGNKTRNINSIMRALKNRQINPSSPINEKSLKQGIANGLKKNKYFWDGELNGALNALLNDNRPSVTFPVSKDSKMASRKIAIAGKDNDKVVVKIPADNIEITVQMSASGSLGTAGADIVYGPSSPVLKPQIKMALETVAAAHNKLHHEAVKTAINAVLTMAGNDIDQLLEIAYATENKGWRYDELRRSALNAVLTIAGNDIDQLLEIIGSVESKDDKYGYYGEFLERALRRVVSAAGNDVSQLLKIASARKNDFKGSNFKWLLNMNSHLDKDWHETGKAVLNTAISSAGNSVDKLLKIASAAEDSGYYKIVLVAFNSAISAAGNDADQLLKIGSTADEVAHWKYFKIALVAFSAAISAAGKDTGRLLKIAYILGEQSQRHGMYYKIVRSAFSAAVSTAGDDIKSLLDLLIAVNDKHKHDRDFDGIPTRAIILNRLETVVGSNPSLKNQINKFFEGDNAILLSKLKKETRGALGKIAQQPLPEPPGPEEELKDNKKSSPVQVKEVKIYPLMRFIADLHYRSILQSNNLKQAVRKKAEEIIKGQIGDAVSGFLTEIEGTKIDYSPSVEKTKDGKIESISFEIKEIDAANSQEKTIGTAKITLAEIQSSPVEIKNWDIGNWNPEAFKGINNEEVTKTLKIMIQKSVGDKIIKNLPQKIYEESEAFKQPVEYIFDLGTFIFNTADERSLTGKVNVMMKENSLQVKGTLHYNILDIEELTGVMNPLADLNIEVSSPLSEVDGAETVTAASNPDILQRSSPVTVEEAAGKVADILMTDTSIASGIYGKYLSKDLLRAELIILFSGKRPLVTLDSIAQYNDGIYEVKVIWRKGLAYIVSYTITDKTTNNVASDNIYSFHNIPLQQAFQALDNARESVQNLSEKKSSPALGTPGGIDFRYINMVTQAQLVPSKDLLKLPDIRVLKAINPDIEAARLNQMMSAGIMPASERIMEFVSACYLKDKPQEAMEKTVPCLVEFFRLQEQELVETTAELKAFLAFIDSSQIHP